MDEPRLGPYGLTMRQLEVLRLKCQHGKTGDELGFALGITGSTMRNHLTTIYRRMGVLAGEQACYLLGRHDAQFAPVPAIRPELV